MKKIKRSWDILPEEKRRASVKETINYFKNERNEEIGIIAAGDLLDFFMQTVGVYLYNKGVEDSRNFLKHRFEDLEIDMDALLRQ